MRFFNGAKDVTVPEYTASALEKMALHLNEFFQMRRRADIQTEVQIREFAIIMSQVAILMYVYQTNSVARAIEHAVLSLASEQRKTFTEALTRMQCVIAEIAQTHDIGCDVNNLDAYAQNIARINKLALPEPSYRHW